MDKHNLLFQYSADGNHIALRDLLNSGVNIHEKNSDGNNALLIAAMNGHVDTVKLLLESGSAIHSTNDHGHTPLIVAAMDCHTEVVKVILEHSRKVSQRKTPSVVAAMAANSVEAQGCNDVADLLRKNPG